MSPSPERSRSATGVAYAAAAYLWWGLFPLYFRALNGVPALEVLAHRIIWSAVFLSVIVTGMRTWPATLRALRAPGRLRTLAVSAAFLSCNWGFYIWAVNSGYALEASLGYYVNPLLIVALGVVFLKDRLTPRQGMAIALAGAGVVALVVRAGRVPWVALVLAGSFGIYGLLRKRLPVGALAGLLGEVGVMLALALGYVVWLQWSGTGHFGAGVKHTVLLALSGIATSLPLIWFAKSMERLRFSTVGIMQYLSPTLQFLIAVFLFGERFTSAHALAFGCIWVALGFYTADILRLARRARGSPGAILD